MPNGTYTHYYKSRSSPRSIHVPPSNAQQWGSSRPRSWRRSRCLTLVAVALVLLLWYSHRGPSTHAQDNATHRMPNGLPDASVDWSRFAYSQYATNGAYLCNSVMLFDQLHRLGSRADRVLFYPEEWDLTVESSTDRDSQLLLMARDKLGVTLVPMNMQSVRTEKHGEEDAEEETWDFSINKFLAWNLTRYDRVLHVDSDVSLRRPLDDLFFLPAAPVAMPRAYWELPHTRKLTSLLVLLTPAASEYEALMHAAFTSEGMRGARHRFDMELLNERYGDSALVLPHRRLALLTGEFRAEDHIMYLGDEDEYWDADKVLDEARLVHFSDWPLPKPWIMWPAKLLAEMLPKCKIRPGTAAESGCQDREVWRALYDDFRARRKDVCKLLSVPAPQWPPPPKMSKPKTKPDDRAKPDDGSKTKASPEARGTL